MHWTCKKVRLNWCWLSCSHKGKKSTWSQNNYLQRLLRPDRQRDVKPGQRSKLDKRSAAGGHKMWTMWSTWSLA